MAITKADIVTIIQDQIGFPKNQSSKIVETLLQIIKKDLESGNDLLISGFGKFCVREKRKRKGRNPSTGENMMLAARRVVTFRCSTILRKKVNKSK
jgi:integration host factor subunit alpha